MRSPVNTKNVPEGNFEWSNLNSGEARCATYCYVESSIEPHEGDETTVAYDSCKYTVRHSKGPLAGGLICKVPTERESSVDADCETGKSDLITEHLLCAADKLCGCACPVKKAYPLHGRPELCIIIYEECEVSPGDDLTDVSHRENIENICNMCYLVCEPFLKSSSPVSSPGAIAKR